MMSHLPAVASSLSLTETTNVSSSMPAPLDIYNRNDGMRWYPNPRGVVTNRPPNSTSASVGNGTSGLGGARVQIQNNSNERGASNHSNFSNSSRITPSWRLRDRMKTVGVGLVMALNVGTDPPDIIKPFPCAKLQCWMDPSSVTRQKAKEAIGARLEEQYARWQQQRAARPLKYRRALDPTVEDVRALCLWLRRQARQERILLHYNGHGVPRPTSNGEIWVFDKNHTEYIPLSVTDLKQWMGKPTIVVLDCSSAGILIPMLTAPVQETPPATPPLAPAASSGSLHGMDSETATSHWVRDTIVLCPTSEGEILPMHPEYPADIFTSCLTTPIQIALRWFVRRNRHSMGPLNPEAVDAIPGQANDRKTPLGELNWIFTAVTDSIAWNVLPKPLFQRLFRQDLLVASMFRNFLLADRILRSLNCTPQSYPALPPGIADHPLWQAWDLACETCLFGLLKDGILGNYVLTTPKASQTSNDEFGTTDSTSPNSPNPPVQGAGQALQTQAQPNQQETTPNTNNTVTGPASSISSPFFSEQLTAFEIWLEYAERHQDIVHDLESPEQLPVVLQVLLSQVHRIRALELLRRFLELGPWAVNLSLSLGIFPYVMKLLQSPEYKSLLVSIWACILKFDPSCQVDLVKDGTLPHFIQPLANWANQTNPLDAAKQRTLAAFSLAATCHRYPPAQMECLRQNLHGRCVAFHAAYNKLEERYRSDLALYRQEQQEARRRHHANMPRPEPIHEQLMAPTDRVWLCLCLGNVIQKCPPAQQEAYNAGVHSCLLARLRDDDPTTRAAAAFALGCQLEYAPEPPIQMPPAMSLGPGLATPKSPQHSLQGGERALLPQQNASSQMGVPARLTASAVLSGQLQPTMGQQPLTLGNRGGHPTAVWPQGGQGPPGQPHPNQLQTQHLMQPMQPMRGGPVQLQPHPQAMHQFQQQNPARLKAPPAVQPLQQMQQPGRPAQASFPAQLQPHSAQLPLPGLSLGGQTLPGGNPMLQPQNILRAPGSAPLMGDPTQQLLMSNLSPPEVQAVPPQMRRRPTLYEDRRTLELDLGVMEHLISALSDGNANVRLEVAMALSNAVEKYINAFLVAAEESSARGSDDTDAMPSESKESDPEKQEAIPVPNGLSRSNLDRFAVCWQELRSVRRKDPHPAVAQLVNEIVSIVHEKLLDAKMEMQEVSSNDTGSAGLSGIAEEDSNVHSAEAHLSPNVTSARPKPHPSSIGPVHRLPGVTYPLRRTASEHSGSHMGPKNDSKSMLRSPPGTALAPEAAGEKEKGPKSVGRHNFPKSMFYIWKKDSFKSNYDTLDGDSMEDRDPLNPEGATRAYQQRRNAMVQAKGRKQGERFLELRPKPPETTKALDLLLDSDEEADNKIAALKGELKLTESRLLKNSGVKMTSLLNFHSYEDVLMVCDDQDGISVWDYEKGSRLLSYKNGNPQGSRMTSSFWINEQTKSLFLVGADDGSVRVWNGLVDERGSTSFTCPMLSAAFFAVPDMQAGQRGSGLICEWQQYSESLIAGGSSRQIRYWDLSTEKCVRSFETGTDAVVTTLTTAWEEELGTMQGVVHGIGPDIIVSGHSDGSLRLFDVRCSDGVARIGGKSRRHVQFTEHRSWIVDTAFTTYGGRYEVVSGSVAGDIRTWDLRSSSSLRCLEAQRSPMTALAVHKHIPIVAAGSHAQFIKIMTLDGESLQVVRFHEQMPGYRIGPVSCLEFHKQKLVLAAGATNSLVSIYKPKHETTW